MVSIVKDPNPKIKIKYDGRYPNLCSGKLTVIIREKIWVFPNYCLSSGGSVTFDSEWNENVTSGEWSVSEWPKDFPEELKGSTLEAVNDQICHGCCGGCV